MKNLELETDVAAGSGSVHRLVRHLDLFSGIGGFALAAQWCGWETIGFSEIEPYAIRTLQRNWPNVPNLGDIRELQGIDCDIITGGFPCQPYSVAGKQRGANDERDLWPEMLRVIKESRPAWVLGENSPNIRTLALDKIISQLAEIGFACRTYDIPACGVGAWHKRSRYWIVAHNECNDNGRTDRPRWWRGEPQEIAELGIGEDGYWHREPSVGRMVYGIPNQSHRLRGLGNAIVPQVAYELMRAICLANAHVDAQIPAPQGSESKTD